MPARDDHPHGSVDRVRRFVCEKGLQAEIRILEPFATKTSADAVSSLGCSIAEIAKTIAFVEERELLEKPVLVILSGAKRVDALKLAKHLGIKVRKMNANEVKRHTGYMIGGVPPFPHEGVLVLADESLFQFGALWAAAGAPNAVMKVSPDVFYRMGIPKVSVAE